MSDTNDFDAGDAEQVSEKAKADRIRERGKRDSLAAILSHHDGRILFWDYLALCGVFRISHTSNALNTAFNEGQRNIGLKIQADIMEAAPDFYARMLKENSNG